MCVFRIIKSNIFCLTFKIYLKQISTCSYIYSCDTTKQSVCRWQYVLPHPVGLSSLAKEITVATRVRQGSSNELSSRQPLSGSMSTKQNVIHKRLKFLRLRYFPRSCTVKSSFGVWFSQGSIPASRTSRV